MQLNPIYVLTIYEPKSVDPTESTVMSPSSGAFHSDPFIVSTSQTGQGKPYLQLPKGRRSRIDPKTKQFDTGQMTAVVGDKRVDGLNDTAKRWVSQFLGDDNGIDRLLACRAVISESIDGSYYEPIFTGHIDDAKQTGPLAYTITIKDSGDELNDTLFVNEPPTIVSGYAFRAPIQPCQLLQNWLMFPAMGPQPTTYKSNSSGAWYYHNNLVTKSDYDNTIATKALGDLKTSVDKVELNADGGQRMTLGYNPQIVRVRFYTGSGNYDAWLRSIYLQWYGKEQKWRVIEFGVSQIHPGDTIPAGGTIHYAFFKEGDPTEGAALFIDSVHPITFLRDLLKGYFGYLNTDGSPKHGVLVDELSFTALEADTTFPLGAWRITERATSRRDWISENILKAYSLALRLNGDGTHSVIDMRLGTAPSSLVTVTDDDLVSKVETEGWSSVKGDAITRMDISFYIDTKLDTVRDMVNSSDAWPDMPSALIKEDKQPVYELDIYPRSLDLGTNPFELDLRNLHSVGFFGAIGRGLQAFVERKALLLADQVETPFRYGARYLKFTCVRNRTTQAIIVGSRNILQISTLPDPKSKVHGGARYGICIERDENGLTVDLIYLDLGAANLANPPTLGALTLHTGQTQHAVDLAFTRNANNDPVVVQYHITDKSVVTAPGDADAGWLTGFVSSVVAETSRSIFNLPSNSRIWVRGRSEPGLLGGDLQPSVWVRATPDASVVTDSYVAPSGVFLEDMTGGVGLIAWLNGAGSTFLPIQILLHSGAGYTAWTDDDVVMTLPPGTTEATLRGLLLSTTYTVGVRYIDAFGGVTDLTSPDNVMDITTGSTGVQAPRPAGLSVIVPSAITLALFASDATFNLKLTRASDNGSGTAPNVGTETTVAADLPGSTSQYVDSQPVDGTIWWYRLYHTEAGYLDSDPTPWVKAIAQQGTSPDVVPAMPTVQEQKSQTSTTGTLTLLINDPQNRVTKREFKHKEGTLAETAYVEDTTLPYSDTVNLVSGQTSSITYKITGYNEVGQLATLFEKTVIFTDAIASTPKDEGFVIGSGVSPLLVADAPIRFWTNDDVDLLGWTISADAVGSIVLKVEQCTYTNFPTFTEVMAANRPTLSSQQKNEQNLSSPIAMRGKTCTQVTIVSVAGLMRAEVTFHERRVTV